MNTFNFTSKARMQLLIVMIAGLALIGLGYLSHGSGEGHGHGHGDTHHQEETVDHSATTLQHEDGSHDTDHGDEHHDDHSGDDAHAHDGDAHHDDHHADGHKEESHYDDGHHGDDHGAAHGGGHGDAHGGHHYAEPVSAGAVVINNFWAMIMFIFWISISGLFFLAAHTVGWAGWHIMIQKITMSIMSVAPVMIILGIIVFIFGHHHIFEWTDKTVMETDALMASKKAFLNIKTFAILSGVWVTIILGLLFLWWKKLH